MDTRSLLRTRLLLAVGLGTVILPAAVSCGGEGETKRETSDAGSTGGAGGVTGSGGVAGGGTGGTIAVAGTSGTAGASGAAGNGSGAGGFFCEPWPLCATIRRPFLVGSSLRSSSVEERDDWLLDLPPIEVAHPHTREFLAAAWLKDALEEHASVAAFARFTMLMLSVGAPPELIIASQRASLDEVQHARACFALARRYGSRDVGPTPLHVADSLASLSLAELVALTVAEGCIGETLGALLATEQLELASDPEVKRILGRIAKDEARHAELAWKFLAWAFERGGASVERAARESFASAASELEQMKIVDYGVDLELWHAHGRVTCAEARALSRAGIDEVVSPCLEALFGNRPAPRVLDAAV